MQNKGLAIMQGRLLPRYKERYQAFPKDYWQAEFHIAKSLGFTAIEFIIDYEDHEKSPLLTDDGISQILKVQKESGILTHSMCADYFMDAPFHTEHYSQSIKILNQLIQTSFRIGITDIIIPCVDRSRLESESDKQQLVAGVSECLELAEAKNVCINLETDLAPKPFKALLESFHSPMVKVNYDTGNSASLGFNPKDEFEAYGHLISVLHFKDRVLNGGSVPLGTGDTNFEYIFSELKSILKPKTMTMQAARKDDYIRDLEGVSVQKQFIEERL